MTFEEKKNKCEGDLLQDLCKKIANEGRKRGELKKTTLAYPLSNILGPE